MNIFSELKTSLGMINRQRDFIDQMEEQIECLSDDVESQQLKAVANNILHKMNNKLVSLLLSHSKLTHKASVSKHYLGENELAQASESGKRVA